MAEIEGRLAGVILNAAMERDKSSPEAQHSPRGPPQAVKLSDSADSKFDAIESLMSRLVDTVDLFKRYPHINSIFNVEILSVDRDLQGRGIAKKLLEAYR